MNVCICVCMCVCMCVCVCVCVSVQIEQDIRNIFSEKFGGIYRNGGVKVILALLYSCTHFTLLIIEL